MSTSIKGSAWRKWDLHIHSPRTNLNSRYNCDIDVFCKAIKDAGLAVIGLTNYFCMAEDEYNDVVSELGDGVFVIPNLEFRTNDRNADNDFINVHVLFNPINVSIGAINQCLARIELNNIASPTSTYCTKSELDKIGYSNITVSLDTLIKQLEKDLNAKDYLIVGIPNGYGGFHPDNKPRSIELAKKIDTLSNIMFGRPIDRAFFLSSDNKRAQLGFKPKPIFVCSDAHTINDIGKKFTWVKCDPSFEGLRQTTIEPRSRVDCDTNVKKPFRSIESISLSFPEGTTLKNLQHNTLQNFCLSELKHEIHFSPYFTCIIGGRGSGKSTIINLIAEMLGEETSFFRENKIVRENKDVLKEYFKVTGTEEIEFVSQGKVEELSEGSHLTELVFNERIKAIGSEYQNKETILLGSLKIVKENISIHNQILRLNDELNSKRIALKNDEKIIASVENPEYKQLSHQFNIVSAQIEKIKSNKENYENLLSELVEVILNYKNNPHYDQYSERIKQIVKQVEDLEEITPTENGYSTYLNSYTKTDLALEENIEILSKLENQIAEYFTSIGVTSEIVADVNRATTSFLSLKKEIQEKELEIFYKNERLHKNTKLISNLKMQAEDCKAIIIERLENINKQLKIDNENVENIEFRFQFDNNKFHQTLFSDFYDQFKSFHKSGLSWENIYSSLKLLMPNEEFLRISYSEFLTKLDQGFQDKNLLYVRVLMDIFSQENNYAIYRLLILKNIYDVSSIVGIEGFYGQVPLSSCSFGQRCTAVVVTLLMTGMKPLLIDEPEAHLDNRLIAEYLVDLIKQKKIERQIIFATHNANFVVNGDAELIHILDIPKGKVFTQVISTTIENLEYRESLLKLEGGVEAFRKRDKKLLSHYL